LSTEVGRLEGIIGYMPLSSLIEAGVGLGIEGAPGNGEEAKVQMVRNLRGRLIAKRLIGQGIVLFRRRQERKEQRLVKEIGRDRL